MCDRLLRVLVRRGALLMQTPQLLSRLAALLKAVFTDLRVMVPSRMLMTSVMKALLQIVPPQAIVLEQRLTIDHLVPIHVEALRTVTREHALIMRSGPQLHRPVLAVEPRQPRQAVHALPSKGGRSGSQTILHT